MPALHRLRWCHGALDAIFWGAILNHKQRKSTLNMFSFNKDDHFKLNLSCFPELDSHTAFVQLPPIELLRLGNCGLSLRVDAIESILEAILEDILKLVATLEAILVAALFAILVAALQHNP